VAFGVRGAPPVVWVAKEGTGGDEAKSLLLDVDRTRVIRRVPLALAGVGDVDPTGLRAVPLGVEGERYIWPLESDMALRGEDGAWSLASRDGYAHDCLLMHPAFLPRRAAIPRADAPDAAGPVSVELVRGAPVELRFAVDEPLHDLDRPTLWVAHANVAARVLSGGALYAGPLPLTAEQRQHETFALPLPFALGPGSFEIRVDGMQGNAKTTVEIEGQERRAVDLGTLAR
jgi:hypothetical protein